MEMVKIERCSATSCSYNDGGHCHTFGINIDQHAECKTFIVANVRGGLLNSSGGAGACLASNCEFNQKMECVAKNIHVDMKSMHPDCSTYRKRK